MPVDCITYQHGAPGIDEGVPGVPAELGLVLVLDDEVELVELPILSEGAVQLGLRGRVQLLLVDEDVGEAGEEGGSGADVLDEDTALELLPEEEKKTLVDI